MTEMQNTKKAKQVSRNERILAIFHILMNSNKIETKEICGLLKIGNKTVRRDIVFLRATGRDIKFLRTKDGTGFVMDKKERGEMSKPRNQSEAARMTKILRLTRIMQEMPENERPDLWYRENFPDLSSRTMQRDFKLLTGIGYDIIYDRQLMDEEYNIAPGYREREWSSINYYSLEVFDRCE